MWHRANKLQDYKIAKLQNPSRGYILLTLMLFISLLAIAAMAVLPEIAFQIKRDREEEMIHRALAYSRAVKRYYKKFGRYPSRLEELENTNHIRFLRKRYTDPVNKDQDFKILHLSDVMLNSGPIMGQTPGQQGNPFNSQGASGFNSQGASAFNPNAPQGAGPVPSANAGDPNSGNPPTNANSPVSSSSSSSSDTSSSSQQVLGGGPILGVASASKEKTIREFYDKNHYNDWLFIYNPVSDRGGLLNAPVQPGLALGAGTPAGTPGRSGGTPAMVPPSGQPGGITPPSQGPPNPPQMPPDQ